MSKVLRESKLLRDKGRIDGPAATPSPGHPWQVLEREQVHHNVLFTIRRDRCRAPLTERVRDFFVLETCDWVNVIPVTDRGEVILVEQFRHGSGALSLEIPGGMVDEADPTPLAAAVRELKEETGHGAREWSELGTVLPNPAIQGNRCTTFLAAGAFPLGPAEPDPWEDIRMTSVPLQRIPELIRDGTINHSLVIAAFHWLELFEASKVR